MNRTLIVASLLASISHGCSHVDVANPDPVAPAPGGSAAPAAAPQAIYRIPIDGLPSMGDPRAPVTLVAFTDYQCPFCRRAEPSIAKLRAEYGADVRVVVAELPLPMHDRAEPAALAALAAAQQGAYEAMRARLFAGALDDASIRAAAQDLGLDMARFDADLVGAAPAALARSQAIADRLGVRGTPTFFANGRRIAGAQPVETFEGVLTERIAAAHSMLASGVRSDDVYARATAGGLDRAADEHDDGPGCNGATKCNGKDDGPAVGDEVEAVPVEYAPARGSAWAPITVVEFADYQCPFCARAEATIHAIEQAHPGDVRVVFEDMPLPFHPNARPMASAAIAADAQGKFWEMHDRLFALGGAADRDAIDRVARDLGLDVARFDRDMDDPATSARIDAEVAVAGTLHVTGTPTFFVNGHRVVGAQPPASFEKAIAIAKK